jgi:oligopeptidase B
VPNPVPVPTAPRDPGEDPYAWMRDDVRLLPHLEAERAAFDARMAPFAALTAQVLAELVARTPDAERSVSADHGSYAYYTLTPPGRELPELRRRGPGGDELLVDLAEFGSPYAATGVEEPDPTGTLLAYSVDITGAERYTLRFRDMGSGADIGLEIGDTYYTGAWAGEDFYFTVVDELNRPCEVHRVNPRTGERRLVLTEPDQRFELTVRRSQDRVVIASHSRTTSECWGVVDGEAVSLRPRVDGVEYDVEYDTDRWVFLSNADATEFALTSEATPTAPALDIREGRIHDMVAFDDALVSYSRINGQPCIRILERDGRLRHELRPEIGGALRLGRNRDPHAGFVTVVTESFTDPTQWWDVDLITGERRLRHAREVPGHDPSAYVSEVIHATASDGWRIPIVVTRRRDTRIDAGAPCMLYGYGSYESVDDPWFESWVLPLLDRGVVYAKAHIRGGGEVGRQQWIDGHLLAKRNSFTDFIAAADHLVEAGIAGPIVGRGGSAGGLLQGAVYAMAPQRWAGIIAEVPFVDCVNSMLDPDIPLTITEWEEWGDPRIPEQREYMESYTPYLNLPDPAERPPLLVTGAVHDPRVLVHEPAKWVAALRHSDPAHGDRERITDRGSIVFRVETGEGSHGGQAGRYAALAEEAEVVAWTLAVLGADTKA